MTEQLNLAKWTDCCIREVRVNYVTSDKPTAKISGPVDIADFVRSVLIDNSREQFIAMYFDASHYQPISNHLDRSAPFNFGSLEGTFFETFGNDLAFVKSQGRQMIWTLLATEGHVTIFSGYHFVNRLATARKWIEMVSAKHRNLSLRNQMIRTPM